MFFRRDRGVPTLSLRKRKCGYHREIFGFDTSALFPSPIVLYSVVSLSRSAYFL